MTMTVNSRRGRGSLVKALLLSQAMSLTVAGSYVM